MTVFSHFFSPRPGDDLRDLAVELVICDEAGRPRVQSFWNARRLLDGAVVPQVQDAPRQ